MTLGADQEQWHGQSGFSPRLTSFEDVVLFNRTKLMALAL